MSLLFVFLQLGPFDPNNAGGAEPIGPLLPGGTFGDPSIPVIPVDGQGFNPAQEFADNVTGAIEAAAGDLGSIVAVGVASFAAFLIVRRGLVWMCTALSEEEWVTNIGDAKVVSANRKYFDVEADVAPESDMFVTACCGVSRTTDGEGFYVCGSCGGYAR